MGRSLLNGEAAPTQNPHPTKTPNLTDLTDLTVATGANDPVQTYDILMAIILIGAMIFGAIKGFAWQLASIASIVVSYLVAYHYREPFSQNIHAEPPWNRFLAMLILYVGTSLVIWVAFRMISGTIDRMKLKEFDRQIGALFGLAKGAIVCTLITLFAVTLFGDRTRGAIVASRSGHWIARLLDQSDAIMPPEFQQVIQPYLNQFDDQYNQPEQSTQWFSETPPTHYPAWSRGAPATTNPGPSQYRSPYQQPAQPTPNWQQATAPTWQPPR